MWSFGPDKWQHRLKILCNAKKFMFFTPLNAYLNTRSLIRASTRIELHGNKINGTSHELDGKEPCIIFIFLNSFLISFFVKSAVTIGWWNFHSILDANAIKEMKNVHILYSMFSIGTSIKKEEGRQRPKAIICPAVPHHTTTFYLFFNIINEKNERTNGMTWHARD